MPSMPVLAACTCGCSTMGNGGAVAFSVSGPDAATCSTLSNDFPAAVPKSLSLSIKLRFSACKLASSRSWVAWTLLKDRLSCFCKDFSDMGSISGEPTEFGLPEHGIELQVSDAAQEQLVRPEQLVSCEAGVIGFPAFLACKCPTDSTLSNNLCSKRAKHAFMYFLISMMSRTFAPWSPRNSSMTFIKSSRVKCFSPKFSSPGICPKIVSAKSTSPMTSTPTS
mmetsp:Transcript_42763/g.84698  ORF Transcript_42763/g.84698 Transcript_42763/m.84698 type:complete len:223 (+) Transcript_42763:259-927(+)